MLEGWSSMSSSRKRINVEPGSHAWTPMHKLSPITGGNCQERMWRRGGRGLKSVSSSLVDLLPAVG